MDSALPDWQLAGSARSCELRFRSVCQWLLDTCPAEEPLPVTCPCGTKPRQSSPGSVSPEGQGLGVVVTGREGGVLGEEGQGVAMGRHFPLLPDTPCPDLHPRCCKRSRGPLSGLSHGGAWRMGCSTSSALGPGLPLPFTSVVTVIPPSLIPLYPHLLLTRTVGGPCWVLSDCVTGEC